MTRLPRLWNAEDRTGGALDIVLDEVRRIIPTVEVERLHAPDPGDDNGYILGEDTTFDLVKIETGPGGQLPFTIASFHWTVIGANGQVETNDPAEAVRLPVEDCDRTTSPYGEADHASGRDQLVPKGTLIHHRGSGAADLPFVARCCP